MPQVRALRAAVLGLLVLTAPACPPSRGALVLDEGFTGTSLDLARWGTCHWWGADGCTILTNDELEWYVPEQVTVAGGVLRLTARPGEVVAEGRRFPYVSGMVSTGRAGDEPDDRARVAFTYGRVEVRFRVPRGAGLWPALWMLPASNHHLPEIDLLEVHGDAPTRAALTLHDADGGRRRREVTTADLSRGWHTATLDWAPGRLTWAVDGTTGLTVTGPTVPDEPMYLVANLAVGGDAGTPTESTPFPATFLIDHVSVRALP